MEYFKPSQPSAEILLFQINLKIHCVYDSIRSLIISMGEWELIRLFHNVQPYLEELKPDVANEYNFDKLVDLVLQASANIIFGRR